MIYNLLVIFLVLYSVLFYKVRKTSFSTKFYLISITFILCFFSAFRYENKQSDFRNYQGMFRRIANGNWLNVIEENDFGNAIIMKLLSYISKDPQIYFIATSVFIIGSFMYFIFKYSSDIYLSVIIFVCSGTYFYANNITRQYIAIAICLYAFSYLLKKKWKHYFFIVLLAATIHLSAFVLIPFYFISKYKKLTTAICIYLIGGILFPIIYNGLQKLIGIRYFERYTEDAYGTTEANILNIILPGVCFIFMLLYKYRMGKSCERLESRVQIHGAAISFAIDIAAVTDMLIINRMGGYFTPAYLLLIPEIVYTSTNKKIIRALIVCVYLGHFFIANYVGRFVPNPYHFFWAFS